MTVPNLRLIVIRTTDLSRSALFYRSLSIELTEERHGKGPLHLTAKLGELVLEIYPAKTPSEADAGTRLGFAVGDLPETIHQLKSQNVEIVQETEQSPWGLRAIIKDPDGRLVELYQSGVGP